MAKLFPSVPRTDFGPAPPGYIPGYGRGAVGFTTRSDIGPARPMEELLAVGGRGRGRDLMANPQLSAYGRGTPGVAAAPPAGGPASAADKSKEDADVAKYSDTNYDENFGFTNERLFASGEYDADDREADMIYEAIDRHMSKGSKTKKRKLDADAAAKNESANKIPAIHKQFAEIKRTLRDVTLEEWENIPEAQDYSHQNKLKAKVNEREKFTPVPDNILNPGTLAQFNQSTTVVDGIATPAAALGTITADLTSVGRARDKVLSMKLDRMADNVNGQTVVDPKGYLTSQMERPVTIATQQGDIQKATTLLNSVIQTNPKHGPGWIARARLAKETGKLNEARSIMLKGCEQAPNNEDVWIEAAALQTPKSARAVLAKAVQHLPTSINIWMMAANLETDVESQKAVLRRALEHLPTSVRLWKTAISLESANDARIMLSRAVELIPDSVEMWLALAKLETYEQARIILNRARKAIPTDSTIWISAARLEEAQGHLQNVSMIIGKAVQSLAKFQVVIDRESWLQAAEEAEKSGSPVTSRAIVQHTVGLGVEELDRKLTWMNDIQTYENRGSTGVARSIAQHLCATFPTKRAGWMKAAQLERAYGTKESLEELLLAAVRAVPTAESLWLMRAKEAWLSGNLTQARSILKDAFEVNKNSEEIWLAAVKLEYESGEYERARGFLADARKQANTPRVWMKSAKMERLLGNNVRQQELLEEGIKRFHDYPKLHLMYTQMLWKRWSASLLSNNNAYANNGTSSTSSSSTTSPPPPPPVSIDMIRNAFKSGIKSVGKQNVDIWILYAKFEIEVGLRQQAERENGNGHANGVTVKKEGNSDGDVDMSDASPHAPAASTSTSSSGASSNPLIAPSASSLLLSTPYSRARSILETARLHMPHQPRLWLEATRVELLSGNKHSASLLQAKAMQDCPKSGLVWAQTIALDDAPKKKSRTTEAIEKCEGDQYVLLAAAKLFWSARKLAGARIWFQRCVEKERDYGDAWIYYYKFEKEHGTKEQQESVLQRAIEADPTHGEIWCAIAKEDRNAGMKVPDIIKLAVRKLSNDIFSPYAIQL